MIGGRPDKADKECGVGMSVMDMGLQTRLAGSRSETGSENTEMVGRLFRGDLPLGDDLHGSCSAISMTVRLLLNAVASSQLAAPRGVLAECQMGKSPITTINKAIDPLFVCCCRGCGTRDPVLPTPFLLFWWCGTVEKPSVS